MRTFKELEYEYKYVWYLEDSTGVRVGLLNTLESTHEY